MPRIALGLGAEPGGLVALAAPVERHHLVRRSPVDGSRGRGPSSRPAPMAASVGQQPGGLRRERVLARRLRPQAEPVPGVDGLGGGLLVVAVRERRRAGRPRVARRTGRTERSCGQLVGRPSPRRCPAPSRFITGASVFASVGSSAARMPAAAEEVAVVEVVVVELVRPERRREADEPSAPSRRTRSTGRRARRSPSAGSTRAARPPSSSSAASRRRPRRAGRPSSTSVRRAVERLAAEVGVRRERRASPATSFGSCATIALRCVVVDAVEVERPGAATVGAQDVRADPAHSSRAP